MAAVLIDDPQLKPFDAGVALAMLKATLTKLSPINDQRFDQGRGGIRFRLCESMCSELRRKMAGYEVAADPLLCAELQMWYFHEPQRARTLSVVFYKHGAWRSDSFPDHGRVIRHGTWDEGVCSITAVLASCFPSSDLPVGELLQLPVYPVANVVEMLSIAKAVDHTLRLLPSG